MITFQRLELGTLRAFISATKCFMRQSHGGVHGNMCYDNNILRSRLVRRSLHHKSEYTTTLSKLPFKFYARLALHLCLDDRLLLKTADQLWNRIVKFRDIHTIDVSNMQDEKIRHRAMAYFLLRSSLQISRINFGPFGITDGMARSIAINATFVQELIARSAPFWLIGRLRFLRVVKVVHFTFGGCFDSLCPNSLKVVEQLWYLETMHDSQANVHLFKSMKTKNLKVFGLTDSAGVVTSRSLRHFCSNCPNVEKLSLQFSQPVDLRPLLLLNRIKKLCLFQLSDKLNGLHLGVVCRAASNTLKTLELIDCPNFTDVRFIGELSKIHRLVLRSVSGITVQSLYQLPLDAPLRVLDLTETIALNRFGKLVRFLVDRSYEVRELWVDANTEAPVIKSRGTATAGHVATLLQRLPLRVLSIGGHDAIDDFALWSIHKAGHRLVYLGVGHIPFTRSSVERFVHERVEYAKQGRKLANLTVQTSNPVWRSFDERHMTEAHLKIAPEPRHQYGCLSLAASSSGQESPFR